MMDQNTTKVSVKTKSSTVAMQTMIYNQPPCLPRTRASAHNMRRISANNLTAKNQQSMNHAS